MIGDGFGGRQWYVSHNYGVGSYSAFTVCGVDSQLYAWGGNFYGELGIGTNTSTETPVLVPSMNHVKFYTAGYIGGAIKNDNTAWIWSGTSFLNVGLPIHPTQVLSDVKFMDAGSTHAVFVKNDGTVWGIGRNNFGELGNGTSSTSPITTPVQMIGINNAVRAVCLGLSNVTLAVGASLILLNDGTVKLTGSWPGYFSVANSKTPVIVAGLNNIVDIKGSTVAAFALDSNGDVYSFGNEHAGGSTYFPGILGLGDNSLTGFHPPTKIIFPSGAKPIVALSASVDGFSVLALDSSHNVYGWGYNGEGQLGSGDFNAILTPQLIASNVIDIYAGEEFSYILKSDNSLWATGYDGTGGNDYYGSIWMNLPNIERNIFTQINPTIPPMNLCTPTIFGTLPVYLIEFNCTSIGETANLTWVSAEEINLNSYIVEYSLDGINFNEITRVKAKGSGSKYYFNHHQFSNKAFYRLKMMDNDGKFQYSEIQVVRFTKLSVIKIVPNPSSDVIYVYAKSYSSIQTIEVLNINGRLLKKLAYLNNGQPVNVTDLPNGRYILRLIYRNGEIVCKIFSKL